MRGNRRIEHNEICMRHCVLLYLCMYACARVCVHMYAYACVYVYLVCVLCVLASVCECVFWTFFSFIHALLLNNDCIHSCTLSAIVYTLRKRFSCISLYSLCLTNMSPVFSFLFPFRSDASHSALLICSSPHHFLILLSTSSPSWSSSFAIA